MNWFGIAAGVALLVAAFTQKQAGKINLTGATALGAAGAFFIAQAMGL